MDDKPRCRCALAMDEEERLKAELARSTKSERAPRVDVLGWLRVFDDCG